MAIQREDCYRLNCDDCKKSFHEDDPDNVYYPDASCLADAAENSEWHKVKGQWYCLDCWLKLPEEDE